MEKPDVNALAQRMIEAVRGFVALAEAALGARLTALEGRLAAIPAGPKGDKGDKGEPGESIRGEKGEPGKDSDPQIISAAVARAAAAIPAAKDGAPGLKGESIKGDRGDRGEPGKDADPAEIAKLVREAVAALPKPTDGKGVTVEDVTPLIVEEVRKAVLALPKAKDGESVPLERVERMVDDAVAKSVSAVRLPKDGEPGRDAAELDILPSIDEAKSYRRGTWASHNGGLIRAARQTDVVKDGAIIEAGWVVMLEGQACPPVFTQGEDPREITCAAMLTSGAKTVTTFRMPVMIYREVWREGEYVKGDVVTWGGSAWHCQQKTTDKPGTSAAWKLMVKEGARGKDGDARAAGPREPVRLR